jgi:putative peptidoglycan lipid II flippase
MVTKFLRLLGKEVGGLHQAAYLLGIFAFGSQILALVRDRLLAHQFGAGSALDVYYAAFRIPDFIFTTVGSIVALSVIIPFFVERLERNREEAREYLDHICSFFFVLITGVSIVAFFLMPFLSKILFPGFTGKEYNELVFLSRILLLSPILLGLSNIFGAITQSFRRFFIYSLSPIVYNLGIIFGIVLLSPIFGVRGVVFGLILGAALHAGVQLPFIISQKMTPRPRLHFFTPTIKKSVLLSIPRTIALGSSHIASLVLIAYASTFAVGSIAVFVFAFNLQSIPLTIIGVSYSLATFPTLARAFSKGDHAQFLTHISAATRHIIFWSLPIMGLFIVLRAHIVRVILGSGAFNWSDTRLTAATFALFTISVVFQSLILLFARGMYAMGKTILPLIANLLGAGVIVACAFLFVWVFRTSPSVTHFVTQTLRVDDLGGTSVLMLALAFSAGSAFNCAVLWVAFQKRFPTFTPLVGKTLVQSVVASLLGGIAAYITLNLTDNAVNLNSFFGILSHGVGAGIVGGAVWYFLLFLFKNHELSEITSTLKRKIWKTNVVGPAPEVTL